MIVETAYATDLRREESVPANFPPPPELGDVIDSLDDAAASLKVVVRNQTQSALGRLRGHVRSRPLAAIAVIGSLAYLIGRLRR